MLISFLLDVFGMPTTAMLSKACMLCLCVLFCAPSVSSFEPPPRRPTVKESLKNFSCPPRDDSNFVLTAAFSMHPLQLCPFGRSIEMHSPGTFVVIFIEDVDVDEWKLQKGGNVVTARVPAGFNTGGAWHQWRWVAYHAYLEMCGYLAPDSQKSGMMAILDGRDAIFQDDLWKNPMMLKAQETTSVILTLEGNPERNGESWTPVNRTIRTEEWNRNWVGACFEDKKVPDKFNTTIEDILDSPISCSGTTMGSSTAVGSYVASMVDELFNCPKNCWNQAGADQAVHNYLVTIAIQESDTGGDLLPWNSLVLVTGIAPAYNCALGRNLHLKHGDVHRYYLDLGSYEFLPPVVHQYDRIGGMPTMMGQFDCYFKI
eukprot:gene18896-25454_t